MACEDRVAGVRDLRTKLQRKSLQHASVSGKGALSGVRDLREKLSGTMNTQPVNSDPPKTKLETTKPVRKNAAVEASRADTKIAADPTVRKRNQQKV